MQYARLSRPLELKSTAEVRRMLPNDGALNELHFRREENQEITGAKSPKVAGSSGFVPL